MKKTLFALIPLLLLGAGIWISSCDGYDVDIDFPPDIYLVWPEDGDTVLSTDSVIFRCAANDRGHGPVTGEAVVWTSDKDGFLGYGQQFGKKGLSVNTHDIEILAKDSMNNSSTLHFTLYVR